MANYYLRTRERSKLGLRVLDDLRLIHSVLAVWRRKSLHAEVVGSELEGAIDIPIVDVLEPFQNGTELRRRVFRDWHWKRRRLKGGFTKVVVEEDPVNDLARVYEALHFEHGAESLDSLFS